MTVNLNWPPDIVAQLTERAQEKGLSLDDYLLQAILDHQTEDDREVSEGRAGRRTREEVGQSIRERREGNVLGPSLDIRDLIEEGRI